MNKKITARGGDDKLRYCILSGDADLSDQLHEIFAIKKGYGISVDLYPSEIRIIDYYHAETRGSLPVVSVEDTDLPVALYWTELE